MNEKREQTPDPPQDQRLDELQPKDLTREQQDKVKGGLARSERPEGHN